MRKAIQEKRIIVPFGLNGDLAREFGTTRATVRDALRYVNNSELARKIREAALTKYDGREGVFTKIV